MPFKNSWKVNHFQQILLLFFSSYKNTAVWTEGQKFSRGFHGQLIFGDKSHLGIPADCLNFPVHSCWMFVRYLLLSQPCYLSCPVLDVENYWFNVWISICYFYLLFAIYSFAIYLINSLSRNWKHSYHRSFLRQYRTAVYSYNPNTWGSRGSDLESPMPAWFK